MRLVRSGIGSRLSPVPLASFSTDDKLIATASSIDALRLWNLQTGGQLRVLERDTYDLRSACLSPGNSRLATTSFDNTTGLWEMNLWHPRLGRLLRIRCRDRATTESSRELHQS